jgi:hypothetical protein
MKVFYQQVAQVSAYFFSSFFMQIAQIVQFAPVVTDSNVVI